MLDISFARVSFALFLLSGVCVAGAAAAEDFTIDTATTATNGGYAIDGNDTLTITPFGSVVPPSGDPGVNATGGNNVIDNSGSIQTGGIYGHGIRNYYSGNSPITNSGSVLTEGGVADGIYNQFSGNSPITNSGSVHTLGAYSNGIINYVSDNSPITNSGSVYTEGDGAAGIYNYFSAYSPIASSGPIHTVGESSVGIYNDRSDYSSVTNSGSIHTEGFGAFGIHSYYTMNSPVTNSGSILTQGRFAWGIYNELSGYSPIINSGSVHTESDYTYGIYNDHSDNSPITSSGSVDTQGFIAFGIYNNRAGNSAITNSGSVHTEGGDAHGIYNYYSDNSAITNSGSVHTEGDAAHGIFNEISSNSPITNSGAIRTDGVSAHGIYNVGTSSVTNSGSVVSARYDAIRFIGTTDSALNLLAPSYLGGAITLSSVTPTLNITTGPSHSVLWHLPANMNGGAPNVSGPVPWFYNSTTSQFATYDPSAFAGSLDTLGDMTGLLSRVGRAGLDADMIPADNSFGLSLPSSSGGAQAASSHQPAMPSPGAGFWIAGVGGSLSHDGNALSLDRTIDQNGFALGYRGRSADGFDWGIMGGYLNSQLDVSSRWTQSYDISGRGWFAGLNGRQQLGGVTIDFGVNGGWSDYDQARFVNDNLALTNGLTLGQSWANASYDGWFVSPEIGISADLGQWGEWRLTPSARIRYAGQWLGGYTESGSSANATVGDRALGLIEADGEVALSRSTGFGMATLHLGYLNRSSVGDSAAGVTMLGVADTVPFGDGDTDAGYAGIDFYVNLAAGTKLAVDFTGYFSGEMTGHQGFVKLVATF